MPRTINCWDCGIAVPAEEAVQFADHMYDPDCVELAVQGSYGERPLDTPSLQTENPEVWAYLTNNGGRGY